MFNRASVVWEETIVLLFSKKRQSYFCRPREDKFLHFCSILKKIHFFFFKIFFQFEIHFCSYSLFSFNFASAQNLLQLKFSFASNSFPVLSTLSLQIPSFNSKFLLWTQNSSFFDSFSHQNSLLKSNSRSF